MNFLNLFSLFVSLYRCIPLLLAKDPLDLFTVGGNLPQGFPLRLGLL